MKNKKHIKSFNEATENLKNMENFTKEEMIEFAKFCFRKYLVEGYPEEVTHKMLFKMWLETKK